MNSIFKFDSSFFVLFINFVREIKNSSVFKHLLFMRKEATQKLFCNLLSRLHLGTFLVFCCDLIYRSFLTCPKTLGKSTHTGLADCFFKERILTKEQVPYYYTQRKFKARRFSFRNEELVWKIFSWLCRDPTLNKQGSVWPEKDEKHSGFIWT